MFFSSDDLQHFIFLSDVTKRIVLVNRHQYFSYSVHNACGHFNPNMSHFTANFMHDFLLNDIE